jgi:tRNA nucleotidyltransferase (CCA-adding enzyme)
MTNIEVEKQVIKQITPTIAYKNKVQKVTKEIWRKIEREIKKRKLPVTVELVGSIAKDTYLQDDMDIDFFIWFPTNHSKQIIAKYALSIGKSLLTDTEESYAEHPYIRGYYDNFYVEVVPCYKIENANQKLSAVDRTPLHTKFVIENITPQLKQEVRLFKQFLKGINCYGAEAQIEGFSGYLCEILIIKYKKFKTLLKKASNWKLGEKIVIKKGNYPDFYTPLVFIDPVDSNRNVASALSMEKFDLFIKACNQYLNKPNITFFFPNKIKPWNLEDIRKKIKEKNYKYISIKFSRPEIIDENLYPQVRKATKSVFESCKRFDFKVYDVNYFIDKTSIFIIIKTEKKLLDKTMIHVGPPVEKLENTEDFLKKWQNNPLIVKNPYIKDKRWYVEIKREYRDIFDFLSKEFKNLSLGKHIDKIAKKKYIILKTEDLIKEKLRVYWTKYLDGKMSWER